MCIIAIASTLKVKLQPLSRPFATRRVHLCNHLLTLRWSRKLGISRNVSLILLHSRRLSLPLAFQSFCLISQGLASSSSFSLAIVTRTFSQTLASSRTFSQTLANSRRLHQNFPYSCHFPRFLTNSREISPRILPLYLQIRARSRRISQILAGSAPPLTRSRSLPQTSRSIPRNFASSRKDHPRPITRSLAISRPFSRAHPRDLPPPARPPALAIPRTIVN